MDVSLRGIMTLFSTSFFWWIPRWSDKDGFRRLKPGLRTSEGLRTLGTLGCELGSGDTSLGQHERESYGLSCGVCFEGFRGVRVGMASTG